MPVKTCVPGAGFWVITDPAGTVELVVVVTGPSVKFALVIALVAAACVRPTTFGTATCDGPLGTTSVTALPARPACLPSATD